jgi:Single-strand binding protein family.
MNFEEMSNNRVYLSGRVVEKPHYSHEVMGEGFYDTKLAVKRISEQVDIIPITVSERLFTDNEIVLNDTLSIEGQFRSYNKFEDGKSRLILSVFVREILDNDEERNPNIIELSGYVCKPTIYRMTPFKREICDILLAVNRSYGKSDYIPCIAWGRNARFAQSFAVGEQITVSGRVQSREYQKVIDGVSITKTAYEVSVGHIALLNASEIAADEL